MTSGNSDFDLPSQFSPVGKVNQVEYATNATKHSGTAIGMTGSDGIILAVENNKVCPLNEKNSNLQTFTIDQHIGAVVAGILPDARNIINEARTEASDFADTYGSPIPLTFLRKKIGAYVHSPTLYSSTRPFGASLIFGSYIPDGPQLYCIQPSGSVLGYAGCAIGKAADEAVKEMENIDLKDTPIVELVKEAVKVIYAVHDEDATFDLELSWCGRITDGKHVFVPSHVHEEAEDAASVFMLKKEESSNI